MQDDAVESRINKELEQMLCYERPFYLKLADSIKNAKLSDVYDSAKYLMKTNVAKFILTAGLMIGAAALVENLPANRIKKSAAAVQTTENYSEVQCKYTNDEISAVSSSTTVPQKILHAIDFAVSNSPDYAAYCRQTGRIGPIPIDSLEQGVLPKLLEDKELCLAVAAETYNKIRPTVKTDLDALVVFFSSQKQYDCAISDAGQAQYRFNSNSVNGENHKDRDLDDHKRTVEFLKKHSEGKLTDRDYQVALSSAQARLDLGGFYLYESECKEEFEKIINAKSDDTRFKIFSANYPGIKILEDSYLNEILAEKAKFEDYTNNLPDPIKDVVQKARAYLNKAENDN
jgi:hypothetical protein